MGLATMEAVPALEAATTGPGVARRGHVRLVLRREVPLAHRVRHVAVGTEDLGEEAVAAGDATPVAGVPDGEVGDPGHRVRVVVAPGEQACPGRRAQRGRVEVGEAHAARGQPVEVRRVDIRPVATELRVADVVEHDHDDVRRASRCRRLRRPPRGRLPPGRSDHTAELGFAHRGSMPDALPPRSGAGDPCPAGAASCILREPWSRAR
jgi:hypothetical protein